MSSLARRLAPAFAVLLFAAGLSSPSAAAATFTVNRAGDADDGTCGAHCTLREAIHAANVTPGADRIGFSIGTGGPKTIRPESPLPTVRDRVEIDGTTQPGYAGSPLITVDGSRAGPGAAGLVVVTGRGTLLRAIAVRSFSAWGVVVRAPDVEVSAAGVHANAAGGIRIAERSGGALIQDNEVSGNGGDGIFVAQGSGHRLFRNSLSGNRGLGIDLAPDGVTPNDDGDADEGPNGLRNTPLIETASRSGDVSTIRGSVSGAPGGSVTVDLFGSVECDPSRPGEAERFVDAADVALDAEGAGEFSFESTDPALAPGRFATATATGAQGTSEVSTCMRVPIEAPALPDERPNLLLVLTDDQPFDAFEQSPRVMPALQARLEDPDEDWVRFTNAYVSTPQCCPSRATILTGQYDRHHGVMQNKQAASFDESSTLATWLQESGYRTGYVGKYLNGWPWRAEPYDVAGWDEPIMFTRTGYFDYRLHLGGGAVRSYGFAEDEYSTDVLLRHALQFVEATPPGLPFFLLLAPFAAHFPFTPAPRHEELWRSEALTYAPSHNEADISDKPAWVRARPALDAQQLAEAEAIRRDQYAALAAVDEAVDTLLDDLESRGILDDTIVVFLSDNGHGSGEHRLLGKGHPYRESVGTELLVRYPGGGSRTADRVVSNVDIAPTLADLAGVVPGRDVDGRSLVPLLEGEPSAWPDEALLHFVGVGSPEWWGLRTPRFAYNELPETGEIELYDLESDPYELENLCPGSPPECDPKYEPFRMVLAGRLDELRSG